MAASLSLRVLVQLAALLLLALGWLAPSARAHEPQRLVFFGDSLSDPGNHFVAFREVSLPPFEPVPSAPYAIGGFHFSNGATWAEQLAWKLHTPASGLPALLVPRVFTNYAVGRARARAGAPVFAEFDLATQIGLFLEDFGGRAPASALHVIWIGGNDLNDALNALAADPSGATSAGIVAAALGAVGSGVQALWLAGAREFLIPNLPNLALTPAVRAAGPQAQVAAALLSASYNAGLSQALDALAALPGIEIIRLDAHALLAAAVADPAAAGLVNVLDPCLRFGVIRNAICRTPNRYLFWDGIHPTRAGHRLLADAAVELLAQR
jgi:outer membrane lipase/esterase